MESHQAASWLEIAAPRLTRLVDWSHLHVPAYRTLGSAASSCRSPGVLALLEALPIVTREDLTSNPDKYTSDMLPRSTHWNSTGGSTGIPLRVLQDSRYDAACIAGTYLFYRWAGWEPTDRILKIWGSYSEAMGEHPTLKRRLSGWLYDKPQLDAFALRAGDAARYMDAIERMQPIVLESYVDAAELLAEFINVSNRRLKHTPRGVVVSAGTLFPDWREDIERAFGCPVYNRYGSREAGDIACSRGAGPLYVNPFTHIVEVVDADGRRLAHGAGRILVTVLNNLSMPLIRYDIGDYATIDSPESLYPVDGWQRLESVDGRHMSMLQGPDGSCFSPELFVHAVGVVHNKGFISQYQVVQRGLEKYTIRLKLRSGHSPEEPVIRLSLDDLRRDLIRVLGPATEIEFAFVDQVEALPSGKVPVCIVRFDEIANRARCHE
jgi:phenylacetate-CoA ligase